MLLSVTEGEDKPLKYPVMFARADLVLITKVDLLPHLPDISLFRVREALARVMPAARVIELSATSGDGIAQWIAWLDEQWRHLAKPLHEHAYRRQGNRHVDAWGGPGLTGAIDAAAAAAALISACALAEVARGKPTAEFGGGGCAAERV